MLARNFSLNTSLSPNNGRNLPFPLFHNEVKTTEPLDVKKKKKKFLPFPPFPAWLRCFSILPRVFSTSLILKQQQQIIPYPRIQEDSSLPGYPPGSLRPRGQTLDPGAAPAGPSPFHSPPPRRPGTGPRPAGLTLSWSHRTLLRFSSGARFRSRPINSSNNCAAEIMVLSSGDCSHQPWHPPKKTPATQSPSSPSRSRPESLR